MVPAQVDLSGTWRAAVSDDELRRAFVAPGFDDAAGEEASRWHDAPVPGHWATTPGLAGTDGPVLYRHRFAAPPPASGERCWLVLDGCFYQADVFLDGSYLGDTEGYFAPHAFEVTDALAAGGPDHVLGVELACSPQVDKRRKRNLTGVFQHADGYDPRVNPGGIWRPVRLCSTGPVAIVALRVRCVDATPERARLHLTATLDAAAAGSVALSTVVDPGAGSTTSSVERRLSAGPNSVSWTVEVASPRLWWPWSLDPAGPDGPDGRGAALVDVVVEVTPLDGVLSDRSVRRTGLRQVRRRGRGSGAFEVNGARLFLKGTAHGPTRLTLGDAPAAAVVADLELAKAAGLDLVRLQAHVARPELYDAADRLGLLLWQDLPLQWGYARTVRREATRQARQAVDLLAHHPSIALWCAHNEPAAVVPGDPEGVPPGPARTFLPSWNRTILDSALARAVERADGSRPVVAHAGVLPHPAWGTDAHLSLGWRRRDERELPRLLRSLPVLGRFVGDIGSKSVPTTADWMEPERWPDLDWEALAAAGVVLDRLDELVPRSEHATFASWQAATQAHQATVVRHHVEHLRRLKYHPTAGFCIASWADPHPAVGFSVLDHERVPKAAHAALVAACAPVLVVADRLPARCAPGDPVALDVHVVNDRRSAVDRLRVDVELTWAGGGHTWAFEGRVAADDVARVGTVSFVVPDAPGPLRLSLVLTGHGLDADEVRNVQDGTIG